MFDIQQATGDELEEIFFAALEDALSEEERAQFAERLRVDDITRQRFADLVTMDTLVQARYGAEDDGFQAEVLHRVQESQAGDFRSEVLRAIRSRRSQRSLRVVSFAAAAVIFAALSVVWFLPNPAAMSSLRVANNEGIAWVTSASGDSQTLAVGEAIPYDRQVFVDNGNVSFTWPDGTAVWSNAGGIFSLREESAKYIDLHAGVLEAAVAKQSEQAPMRVMSDSAEVTVMGTRFRVAASSDGAQVDVHQGRVAVRVGVEDQPLTIEAGEGLLLARGLKPQRWQVVPGEVVYEDDFSDGLPNGWQAGRWQAVEGGFVEASAASEPVGGVAHTFIRSHQPGIDGLGAYRPGDLLNLRVRFAENSQAMFALRFRNPGEERVFTMVYRLHNEGLTGWQQLRIPLNAFALTTDLAPELGARYVSWYLSQSEASNVAVGALSLQRGQYLSVER